MKESRKEDKESLLEILQCLKKRGLCISKL